MLEGVWVVKMGVLDWFLVGYGGIEVVCGRIWEGVWRW